MLMTFRRKTKKTSPAFCVLTPKKKKSPHGIFGHKVLPRSFAFSPWGCDSLDRLRYWLQTADAWRVETREAKKTPPRWVRAV